MIDRNYADFAWEQAAALLAIDSPSGFTGRAAQWVKQAFENLGFSAEITGKGGVLACLGGEGEGLLLEAHTDTLGGMVSRIKSDGRLELTPIGGMRAENGEAENVTVYTREGKTVEGTFQLCNASVHVNGSYGEAKREYGGMEVVLDENVTTAEETRKLGIEVGDYVCFDPADRLRVSQEPLPGRQAQRGHSAGLCQIPGGSENHSGKNSIRPCDGV